MGIGAGIFLVALGAILAFAVHVTTSGFSINTIGIILMIVGVVGILIDLALFMPRRRSVVTTSTTASGYPAGTVAPGAVPPGTVLPGTYPAGTSSVVEERQVY